MERTLQLHKDQCLTIGGIKYCVIGGIEFHNQSDSSRWTEYCLKEIPGNQIKWLSIDNIYEEYAIYTQCTYNREFEELNLSQNGYHQVDSGYAAVTTSFGRIDTNSGDTVRYTEYEDSTEELIMAIEQWEDETEYSRGYYLDPEEIVLLDVEIAAEKENRIIKSGNTTSAGMKKIIIAIALSAVLILVFYTYLHSNQKVIHKYLESNSQFTYRTSITSDLNHKEKADVYTSAQSVDTVVKAILEAISGETENVQKNDEDDSVAILTRSEYCLIYTSTDQITTIQISSRAYVYQSTNTPYHATSHTHSYYRRFYYTKGFWSDRSRYSEAASGYESYNGETISTNPNDPYKSYSDSIRQSSINSRKSSGGGISSGK